MRDHFVLVADQLLTKSIIEADIVSKYFAACTTLKTEDMVRNFSLARKELDIESSPRKLADCRICHDEDEDSNMEIPCSCRGSLKVILLYLDLSFGRHIKLLETWYWCYF